MKSAAVISAPNLGDGLLMMISCHYLYQAGYRVTFFHNNFTQFMPLFPFCNFQKLTSSFLHHLFTYDLVIIQTHKEKIIHEFEKNKYPHVYFLYPTYKKSQRKHLSNNTLICNGRYSMAKNIAQFTTKIINTAMSSATENNLHIPSYWMHKKYKKRVVIHPTSHNYRKNWTKQKFLKLYDQLIQKGYDPYICISAKEKLLFSLSSQQIITPQNFYELAHFIYESGYFIGNDSGPAHLASNLGIPTLVVAGNKRIMKIWKPDFTQSHLVFAPWYIPNCKWLRIRDKCWSHFVPVRKVMKKFQKIVYSA